MTIPTPVAAGGTADAAAPFAVTAPANLELNGRTGKTTFTVTNLGGRPVKARVKPRGGAGADDSWFALASPAEIPMAIGATATVDVVLDLPRKATPGDHTLFLEVVAEDDTETVAGQSVSFTVKGAQAGKSPVLAIVIIAGVLLLLGAAAVWWFVLRQPDQPVSAQPAGQTGQPKAVKTPKASKPTKGTEPRTVITNTSVPSVVGIPQVGEEVRLSSYGTWTPSGLIFLVQWQRCADDDCSKIEGANKRRYVVTPEDVSFSLRARITARGHGMTDVKVRTEKVGRVLPAPDSCKAGFTWRLAVKTDHVCVTEATRDQVFRDNLEEYNRYSSDHVTCIEGYTHRLAVDNDFVCVTPVVAGQTIEDNGLAYTRVWNY